MSEAVAKVGLDVTGLETGTQKAEAAARRLMDSDKRVKDQLGKAISADGHGASRFNSKMIGDIINMGTASSGAVMKVNALTHALKIPAVMAGGMVAVASGIMAIADAANEAAINANKVEESLNRVYRGGLGSGQSESSILKKQEAGRRLKDDLEKDQLEDKSWAYGLKNNILNSTFLGGMGADNARAQRNADINAIRSGEFEASRGVAEKRAQGLGIKTKSLTNSHAGARAAIRIAGDEALAADNEQFTGTDPEAKKRILDQRKKSIQIDLDEDKRKEKIENTLLFSDKLRSTLRQSSDQEHAKALQMELSTAKMVLAMTNEKQEKERATIAVLKAAQAIKENDLRVDLKRISIQQGVTSSSITARASGRTLNMFGDDLAKANAKTQVEQAQSAVNSAVDRLQRETASGSVSPETMAAVVTAQNGLTEAKNAQLKVEKEIAFANKQTLASLTAQTNATYLGITGRTRQAGILTARTSAANQAEALRREGKGDQADAVLANESLQEQGEAFEALGGGKNISAARRALRHQERAAKKKERLFNHFVQSGGGMRGVHRGMNGMIPEGINALTGGKDKFERESDLTAFIHGHGATIPEQYNQPKGKDALATASKEHSTAIVSKLEEMLAIWRK